MQPVTFGPFRSAEIFWEIRKYYRFWGWDLSSDCSSSCSLLSHYFRTGLVIWTPFRYMSVNVWLPCWKSKLQYFSGFHCQFIQGHWGGLISEKDLSGPPSLFWMFSLLLKELVFIFLYVISLTKSTYSDLYATCMWLISHIYVAYKSHTSLRFLVYVSCKFLKLICHLYVAYMSHICDL